MKLVGMLPVRNEAWCLGLTLRSLLEWCDQAVVVVHNSADRTRDIVVEVARETRRVVAVEDSREDWNEMHQRRALLDMARSLESPATHVAILDADELLTSDLLGQKTLWEEIEKASFGQMVALPGYNLRGGLDRYHRDGVWGNRWFSTAFRDDLRLRWNGDRYHHREPDGASWSQLYVRPQGASGVMHLWGVTERRLRAKHAWYQMIERLRFPQKSVEYIRKYYSQWKIPNDGFNLSKTKPRWWAGYEERGWMKHLDANAEPWHEAECRRLWETHGSETFRGLDLFGVIEAVGPIGEEKPALTPILPSAS